MNEIITPAQVEQRLMQLSGLLEKAQAQLNSAEEQYTTAKAEYEVALAKSRVALATEVGANNKLLTATEKEDKALIANESKHLILASTEVLVKAARANVAHLKTQVDIARSIGSSVRSSLEAL